MNNLLAKLKIASAFKTVDAGPGLGAGITAGGFPSIRYRGKTWSLQYNGKLYSFRRADDNTPQTYIDAIILASNPFKSRVYFENSEGWNEDSAGGPICQALKSDVPDPGVPVPQAESCALCTHSEWKTKPGGGRGQECQEHKRTAILLMPSMTAKMLGQPLIEPVHLKIPPGSLTSYKAYGDELDQQGIPFFSVVTRISFSEDKLFQMTFEAVQALTNDEAEVVLPMRSKPQTMQILGVRPEIKEIAAPTRKKAEPIETGILAAFSSAGESEEEEAPAQALTVPLKKKGRPPGSTNKPKVVDADAVVAGTVAKPAAPPEPPPETWEESDTDLDDTVNQLLGEKMGSMFK
jgi:hypothetical protein